MSKASRIVPVFIGAALLAMAGASPASAAGVGTAAAAVPGSENVLQPFFATPVVAVQVGGILPFVNLDLYPHNVCIKSADGTTTMGCGAYAAPYSVTTDTPTAGLSAGTTYPFYCFLHPRMQGMLIALPGV